MNRRIKNIISFLVILPLIICSGAVNAQEEVHLFPDRSVAVSGDTIWFGVVIFNGATDDMSNIVHVQLDTPGNNHISKVTVLCSGGTGTGYIPVPDSLSSGVYVLRAFSFIQKSDRDVTVNQRLVTVFNRFEEELFGINVPVLKNGKRYGRPGSANIETVKDLYERGEKVKTKINVPKNVLDNTLQVIITAGLEDSSAKDFATSWYPSSHKSAIGLPVSIAEKNGILISGKVHSAENNQPVPNSVVILSIPDSIPFFDYCVSDSAGIFYFYLRNAIGTADIVLQALAKNSMQCTIELFENYIDVDRVNCTEKMLNHEELAFADNVIKSSYFTKLFKGYKTEGGNTFTMQRQFKYPFYGMPTKTFYPDLFIDLPDFQEISREILRGVQYRQRKRGTTIRLLDMGGGSIFYDEPLKLLDGIPVFDPEIFAPMGTDDIDHVDAVFFKRFYGDLSFNGVLSIYTKKRSLTWVDANPSIGHFEYPCLQPQKKWDFSNTIVENTHVPNFNKVLYRNSSGASNFPGEFVFATSDLKGDVVIRVVLVQTDRQILYSQKIITVE